MIRVSVVVPTYCRPAFLERCLAALADQDFDPSAFEVLIADDASNENTRQQVARFAAIARTPVRYVAVSGPHGPAAARNAGWRSASGEIIAFTDDDCLPDSRWLTAGVSEFRTDVAAVSGRVIVPLPKHPTDYERDAAGLETAEFVTANCFCRREVLEELAGFDERFSAAWREDSDLHFRLLRSGRRIVYATECLVVHPVRPARWGISLIQQRKALFDALLYKKHPRLYRRRVRSTPPLNYYAMVLLLVVASVATARGNLFVSLVATAGWLFLCGEFCWRRLRGTSRTPHHVAEMVVTSALIPPLSVFWRLYGAWRFRVLFA